MHMVKVKIDVCFMVKTKCYFTLQQVNGDLEFLLKNKDATLSNKVFTYLKLEKDSTVAKQVAGYNLDYLATGLHNEFLQQLDCMYAVERLCIYLVLEWNDGLIGFFVLSWKSSQWVGDL